ncbi:MAG: peptidoglycan DD-metalloendopeptidase family protein [Campylobacterota bacterium]|nr:peptidoglycan DD-metalloendopeptidase family protein [Campylobacterota bacterium]
MKYIIVFVLMFTFTFGMKVTHEKWEKGKTFSEYLESHNISADLLESISKEDQKFLSEINRNYKYYELKDNTGVLIQALIPISKEMQLHLFKKHTGSGYGFDIIPIEYKSDEYFAKVIIEENPYTDTLKTIQQPKVAERISRALKGTINAKKLHKGDEISFVYTQRTRIGKLYGMPNIKVSKVKMGKKEQFIYVDEDGYGYKETGKSVAYSVTGKKKVTYTRSVPVSSENSRFGMPLRHIRITSGFSYRRYHPILKRYRPHHGTDFGARRGTPLLAVNSGKVIFSGWMGGYGKVVKIKHGGGYVSLYAHQSRTRAKRGQRVKKGQVIGYVGSTGRSTGPHLHFGLKKNGRWINPMKVLRKKSIKTSILKKFTKYEDVKETKYKKVDIKGVKENKNKLLAYLKNDTPSYIWGEEDKDKESPDNGQ